MCFFFAAFADFMVRSNGSCPKAGLFWSPKHYSFFAKYGVPSFSNGEDSPALVDLDLDLDSKYGNRSPCRSWHFSNLYVFLGLAACPSTVSCQPRWTESVGPRDLPQYGGKLWPVKSWASSTTQRRIEWFPICALTVNLKCFLAKLLCKVKMGKKS